MLQKTHTLNRRTFFLTQLLSITRTETLSFFFFNQTLFKPLGLRKHEETSLHYDTNAIIHNRFLVSAHGFDMYSLCTSMGFMPSCSTS